MKVLPLRWHGATRREQMRVAIESSVAAWLREWSTPDVRFECVASIRTPWDEASIWAEAISPAGEQMLLRCTQQGLNNLGCLVAGVQLHQSHRVAVGLGRRALQNCLETVMDSAGSTSVVTWRTTSPGAGLDEIRHGTESFRLLLGGSEYVVFANDRLCDRLAPPKAASRRELVPRVVALRAEPIELEAILDLGTMNLTDFSKLRAGDVFKTGARLDARVHVRHTLSEPLAAGALVMKDGRRALELELHHEMERGS